AIDDPGLDHSIHFSIRAQSLPARLAGANDVSPTGITQVPLWIGLSDRKECNETGIGRSYSHLVADSAADGPQHRRVSRAPFRVVLQRVLLGQVEFQYLCVVFGRHGWSSSRKGEPG